jgi:hypothetical protein
MLVLEALVLHWLHRSRCCQEWLPGLNRFKAFGSQYLVVGANPRVLWLSRPLVCVLDLNGRYGSQANAEAGL